MSVPKGLRKEIFLRDELRCRYCGIECEMKLCTGPDSMNAATIDHRTSVYFGGTNDPDNLATACRRCNQAKGSYTEAEFRDWAARVATEV